jgi:hypothetical protein
MENEFLLSKMLYDVTNLLPLKMEDHTHFMKQKDIPFKQILEYQLNEQGSVGDNFVHNPDILALGCSVTVPIGLPHGLSWPHLIKDELDLSLNVVAYGGASVQRILHNATQHIMEYGVPKKIYILLPSLDRAWVVGNKEDPKLPKFSNKYLSDKNLSDLKQDVYYELENVFWIEQIREYNNFGEKNFLFKDFLNIKRSIPLEYGFLNQIYSLINFFSFCKLLGIECFYYSWNGFFDHILLNNPILEKIATHSKILNEDCYWKNNEQNPNFYDDYFSNNIKHEKYWKKGLDIPEFNAHPGMYTHIHFAERFIGRRISQKTIDNAKC